MLLRNKNVVICGGGGAIGGATARAVAHEGAKVFFAGRARRFPTLAEGADYAAFGRRIAPAR